VEVKHHAGPGVADGREAARPDQRLHVVGVHHIRIECPDGVGQLGGRLTPAQQRGRGSEPTRVRRAALEQRVIHTGPP
jgi:hypothetical protein